MALTYPGETIANGRVADGDNIQRKFDYLESQFPVLSSNITAWRLSRLKIDMKVPLSMIPADIIRRRAQTTALDAKAKADEYKGIALYSQAWNDPHLRNFAPNALPSGSRQNIGWLSPCVIGGTAGFILCDKANQTVKIATVQGGEAGATAEVIDSWTTDDAVSSKDFTPYHAIRRSQSSAIAVGHFTDGNGGVVRLDASQDAAQPYFLFQQQLSSTLAAACTYPTKIVPNVNGLAYYVLAGSSASTMDHLVRLVPVRTLTKPPSEQQSVQPSGPTFPEGFWDNFIGGEPDFLGDPEPVQTAAEEDGFIAALPAAPSGTKLTDLVVGMLGDGSRVTKAFLLLNKESSGANQGTILVVNGDVFGDPLDWRNLASYDSIGYYLTSALNLSGGAETWVAMVQVGSNLWFAANDGTDMHWAVISPAARSLSSSSGLILSGTHASVQIQEGSAVYDGRGVHAVCTDGSLLYWSPEGGGRTVNYSPRAGWSGTPALGSNIVFNGQHLVAHLANASADGESAAFMPW